MRNLFLLTMLFMTFTMARAQKIQLPQFFADGMVLQRNTKVPVWGKGEAGHQIDVSIIGQSSISDETLNQIKNSSTAKQLKQAIAAIPSKHIGKTKTTTAADGTWKVYLPKMEAGGPYTMLITMIPSASQQPSAQTQVKTISNILIGDVFLCSGQSNMELPIRRCMDAVADEVRNYSNDNIRYLKFPHQFNYVRPNDDVHILPWQNITPANCAEVSGICYFMARELQSRYNVPIGIINSAVGGTQVQAWMPREILASFDGYDKELQKRKYHQTDWVDSVRRAENKAGMEWEKKMNATDTILNQWNKPGYNFAAWKSVNMFSNWSGNKNGSYWFRATVTIPDYLAGKKGILRFGAMKDADTIFVNGHYVGNTTYEYPPRVYNVKENILRAGENEIIIHLMSQGGQPNFTKGKLYQLEIGELVFPIKPEIQMAVGCTMPRKPASTYFVDTPTGLYNAMIAPLQDFPVKGILWYQGESNQGSPQTYAAMLEAMVDAWRTQLHSDSPIVIMQLPGYMAKHDQPVETGWTRIRHQQYIAAQNISRAALAPTIDTGEYNDIHPQDKKTAGLRAAKQMSKLAYGDKSPSTDVPMPQSARIIGGKAVLSFTGTAAGLKIEGDKLHDFAILINGKYQWAEANITSPNTVTVTLPQGTAATTIRYCWDDYPQPSLFNSEGVPAPQFEITTE